MYIGLLHTHSFLRYLILLLLLAVIVRALIGYITKRPVNSLDNRLGIALIICVHTQFLLGLGLYFVSPNVQAALADMAAAMKDEYLRFVAVEHVTIMLLAVIAITVGRVWSKKAKLDTLKHSRALVCYSIGLVLIIAGIPWEKVF